MRRIIGLIVLASLLALPAAAQQRPNVVIIGVDAMGAGHVSYYGYSRATTPNLDQWMAQGAAFTDATALIPLTTPSWCSFFSSLPPYLHGSVRNGVPMNKDVETLAGVLKQRGYTTYAVTGCAPLHSFRSGLAKDFDVYIDGGNEVLLELEAGIMTRRSLKLFEQGLQEPFLFWIHFPDPHQPHTAVKGFDFRAAPPPGPERRKIEDAYDSEIAYCDHNAGLILDDLKKRGLLDNTLIVMTADHGEHLGGDGKGTTGHGRNLSQGVLQMPMVMTGPGIPAGKMISEPVQTLDFAPTILDYLGLPKGERMMGRSLMSVINQDAALAPIPFFFESYSVMVLDVPGRRWIGRHSPAVVVGMRDQNFKLIHLINKNIWEMYDLDRDPEENTNIFAPGDPGSMRMARELMDWYAQRDRGEKPLVLPD